LKQRFKTVPNSGQYSTFSIVLDEVGIINYEITPLNKDTKIIYKPYIDAGVTKMPTGMKNLGTLEVKKI
jgi:maltose phosphorylase